MQVIYSRSDEIDLSTVGNINNFGNDKTGLLLYYAFRHTFKMESFLLH